LTTTHAGADPGAWQGRMLLTIALTPPDPLAALRGWPDTETTAGEGPAAGAERTGPHPPSVP
jgi:hypothetical protein